ncbi:MAG: carboxymuconolactone decarboxylase family protein [Myxococcota bacterium]|nr:carboxymuconolactone decarboxylase family protein [Myxococcota bacterium]
MPRLAPLEPTDTETRELLASMMPPGIPPIRLFRTLVHSPRVARKLQASNLLDRGPLSMRQRELAILRTTARCGSEYEWGVHVAFFSARVGLDEEDVAATRSGPADDPRFAPDERAILRLVDELHETSRLSDEGWETLRSHFDPAQCVELVALTGFYHSISFMTNAFEIDLEEGAPRFPAPA